jgi:glycosyltransferase involved in cell wall biosynthesis
MTDISVILPSRGRIDSLEKAVASIVAAGDPGVEVIVGLDDDDDSWQLAALRIEKFPGVRIAVKPRQQSVGALFNLLEKEAAGNWLIPFPNDYTITTLDWAARLRDAVTSLPLGLGVAYLADQLYRGFSTFPVISRKTIELQGFFMPEFFPFLFGDTWWNEVGNLCGVKQPIDAHVQIGLEHGNEHRLRDMTLWAKVFEATRPLRTETAIKIVKAIYNAHDAESDWLVSTMPNRVQMCEASQWHMFQPYFLAQWDNTDTQPPSERYLRLKAGAEALINQFPVNREELRA